MENLFCQTVLRLSTKDFEKVDKNEPQQNYREGSD